MGTVLLLLLGAHLIYAATNSLKYFYTAVSGDIDFPEFTIVGLVNEGQFTYFDSNIMKTVPKTEWIRQNVEADYWDSHTEIAKETHLGYKNNIKALKEKFNLSEGVHTYQDMYGCEWDDETGATNGFREYGFDGDDFISLDLKEMRWISPVQQGIPIAHRFSNDRTYLEINKHYFSVVCIESLQKYLQYGKSSLQKTVSPQVFLLQKDPSSPVKCHATGFYPKEVTITWMKNGQDHDEDVDLGELFPNEDGTFQKTSTLRVTPDEWKNNKFSCVVEHKGKTMTVNKIWARDSVPIGIIVGAVLLVVIGVGCVAGYTVYQKKKGFRSVSSSDDDGSNGLALTVSQAFRSSPSSPVGGSNTP